jgi:hypothetical protein
MASTASTDNATSTGKLPGVLAWLAQNRCALGFSLNRYDHERFNLLVNRTAQIVNAERAAAALGGSEWEIKTTVEAWDVVAGVADLKIQFRCIAGAERQMAVSVAFEFGDWSAENYVLLPAAAYNGNRFLSRRIPYSPKLYFVQDIGPDKPVIITDVPRLNIADGPSRIQDRSGSLSTPTMGFRSTKSQTGFLLLTHQGNALGDYGVSVEENRARTQATFAITSPVVREQHSYRICDAAWPSEDQPRDFKVGDEVSIALRVKFFPAPEVQSLFDQFAVARKEFVPPAEPRCVLPFSACFAVQEEKFNRENFVPEHGYYSVGPRTNFLQDWQIGWTGGMISTYPLLFAGGETTRRNVLRNFDWLFPNGISPSGFFWDAGANGTQWIGGDIRKPHTGNWHLIRKSGDAVFFIVKQFRLMEQLGIVVKPAWRDGLRRVCDAFVKLWDTHGQFGQFVDSQAGAICVGGSTSAAIVPAALLLAAEYFNTPDYRRVALAAGEHFYQSFTRVGLSCGGPGDALQNPDSESWYALIESYVALFEATGERIWLARALETTRQFSTWVVSYDFEFPPQSTFAKADIRTTGSVYANTQNKHSAPGLCTFSGLGLLKLFRATGDRLPLELLCDIAFGLPQYLPHPLRPIGDSVVGRMCERVNMTDWEGAERIGETLRMSTWAETSLMLTAVEIPGVYVQSDTALVVAFDNVTTGIVADKPDELVVRITNPTPAAAAVRLLVETRAQAAVRLPENFLLGGRMLQLAAGEAIELTFAKCAPALS